MPILSKPLSYSPSPQINQCTCASILLLLPSTTAPVPIFVITDRKEQQKCVEEEAQGGAAGTPDAEPLIGLFGGVDVVHDAVLVRPVPVVCDDAL